MRRDEIERLVYIERENKRRYGDRAWRFWIHLSLDTALGRWTAIDDRQTGRGRWSSNATDRLYHVHLIYLFQDQVHRNE
jgi:hypothetical protein